MNERIQAVIDYVKTLSPPRGNDLSEVVRRMIDVEKGSAGATLNINPLESSELVADLAKAATVLCRIKNHPDIEGSIEKLAKWDRQTRGSLGEALKDLSSALNSLKGNIYIPKPANHGDFEARFAIHAAANIVQELWKIQGSFVEDAPAGGAVAKRIVKAIKRANFLNLAFLCWPAIFDRDIPDDGSETLDWPLRKFQKGGFEVAPGRMLIHNRLLRGG